MKVGSMGKRVASGKHLVSTTNARSMMSMTGKKTRATSDKHEQKVVRA